MLSLCSSNSGSYDTLGLTLLTFPLPPRNTFHLQLSSLITDIIVNTLTCSKQRLNWAAADLELSLITIDGYFVSLKSTVSPFMLLYQSFLDWIIYKEMMLVCVFFF